MTELKTLKDLPDFECYCDFDDKFGMTNKKVDECKENKEMEGGVE